MAQPQGPPADTFEHALSLLKQGHIAEARQIWQHQYEAEPQNAHLDFLLGVCDFKASKYAEAQTRLARLACQQPRNHHVLYYLGLTHERQEHAWEARQAFQEALRIKPDFGEAQKKLDALCGPTAAPRETMPSAPRLPIQQANRLVPRVINGSNVAPQTSADEGTLSELIDADGPHAKPHLKGALLYVGHRRLSSYPKPLLLVLALVGGAYLLCTAPALQVTVYRIVSTFALPLAYDTVLFLPWLLLLGALATLVGIMLSAWCQRFEIFERRIDVSQGVLSKEQRAIWVFEIQDVWLEAAPLLFLSNNADVVIQTPDASFHLTGLGSYRFTGRFWREVRDAAMVERRAMKKWWV